MTDFNDSFVFYTRPLSDTPFRKTQVHEFAKWASQASKEKRLAERFAAIDLLTFTTVRDIREAIIDVTQLLYALPLFRGAAAPGGTHERFLEINARVLGSTVVLQKSVREGFGLTVGEAPCKKKPVIGGAVGGIKLQIIDGLTGFLVHSPEGAAKRIVQLLGDRKLRERLGENGYEHVKQNFLITRDVKDYIITMLALEHPSESVINLG